MDLSLEHRLNTGLKAASLQAAELKPKLSYGKRGNYRTSVLSFFPTWKRFRTANINLRRTSTLYKKKMPQINIVIGSRCFSLSLAGKVSHVLTITMINQLFFRNFKIVFHLSQELFETL